MPDEELRHQIRLLHEEGVQAEYTQEQQHALVQEARQLNTPKLAVCVAKTETNFAQGPAASVMEASLGDLALICPSLSNAYAAVKPSVFEPLMKIKQAQATT